MKINLFFLTVFLFLSLSCTQQSSLNRTYQQFDRETCNANIDRRTADINELNEISSDNAHNYTVSGTCTRDNSEVKVYIEGHPLDKKPICNRGQWEVSVDITGIINKKERVQVAASQAGSSGLLCKNTTNHFICPTGYIGIPQLDQFTYNNFCVMKYEAKSRKSVSSSPYNRPIIKAEAIAGGNLIKRVSEEEAFKYCKENGAGYSLINNKEWQTIARHIEQTKVNWSNGSIQIGNGNRLNIGNTSGQESTSNENDINDQKWHLNKRAHKLPNNEYIWDFSGNLEEIVLSNISSLPVEYSGYIYNIPTQLKELFGPDRDYTILDDRERIRGFGGLGFMTANRFEGSLLRGGSNSRTAGIFSGDTTITKDRVKARPNIGFRCVYHP